MRPFKIVVLDHRRRHGEKLTHTFMLDLEEAPEVDATLDVPGGGLVVVREVVTEVTGKTAGIVFAEPV